MGTLLQDVKYGLRAMLKSPGFTAIAVITLALGIGANTAIFSVVNAVLVRPLPYPQPNRIFEVLKQYRNVTGDSVSVPLFHEWSEHNRTFASLAAFSILSTGFNLAASGLPERVPGVRVTAEFFEVFGVSPTLGRGFLPSEDRPGGGRVVVISHTLWHSRFREDPNLIGESITLDGQPYTVVGVMPDQFRFPSPGTFGIGADLWVPFQLPPGSRDPANYLAAVGRLKPGVTPQQASAELSGLTQQLRKELPNAVDPNEGATLVPLRERLVGSVRPLLLILLAAVSFVLLIACVNVANLLLSRSMGRAKEIAVRAALGAGRWRVIRQLVVESILLGLLGGIVGLAVAYEGDRALVALSPVDLPGLGQAGLDGGVLLFALVVSVTTGILFGLAPALTLSKTDLTASLRESSTQTTVSGHRRKLSSVLVASETALTLVLLAGAGLLLKSFTRLAHVELGFDPHHVLTFETTLPESRYGTPAEFSSFSKRVLDRLQALSGVESAATVTNLPTESGPDLPFTIQGRTGYSPGEASGDSQYRLISPDYFRVMRIPLLQGRFFTDAESDSSAGVVIINETMARQTWPHENPVGRTIVIAQSMGPDWADRPRLIVGVVGDVKDTSLNKPPPPEMFIPLTQAPANVVALMVRLIPTRWVIRTRGGPPSVTAIRQSMLDVDSEQPLASVKSLEDVLADSITRWRFDTFLLGIFAALSLILAGVGIYGVVSYSVSQRTHEIGIRMAMGARREDVLKLVVGEGFRPALVGVAIGMAGALGLTRFLSSLLYGVKPTDPATYMYVAGLLMLVVLAACYLPARRALRVDPMVALRYE